MADLPDDLGGLQDKAAEAARLLHRLADQDRLLLLCRLAAEGEMTFAALAEALDLPRAALSRLLDGLCADGLVAARTDARPVSYALADPRAARILTLLHDICCQPAA